MRKTIFFVMLLSVIFSFSQLLTAAAGEKEYGLATKQEVKISVKSDSLNKTADNDGNFVLLGEVKNNGDTTAIYPWIKVTMYDANNNKLGTAYNRIYGGTNVKRSGSYYTALRKGDTGFFKASSTIKASKVHHYTYEFEYCSGSYTETHAKLELVGTPNVSSNHNGNTKIIGTIKNTSDSHLTYCTSINFVLYDSSGKVIDVGDGVVFGSNYSYSNSALKPGATGKFIFVSRVPHSKYSSYNYSFEFYEAKTARIGLNRSKLYYCSILDGYTPPVQTFTISNSGDETLDWSISNDTSWLTCTPTSGTNSGVINVSVKPCGLAEGFYTDAVTITDPNASNSPQTVTVNLEVKNPSLDHPPFGSFETPVHGSTVSSSIPVTGWVLDDVEVKSVKIYNGSDYVEDAVFVEGARPDVEQSYPDYPLNYRAGWGYMMLTNFLPNGGNGTYHITAIAEDSEGNKTTLGTKTIICDNEHAVKPFGDIDTPTQGGTASGSEYINWGWVLTPQPKYIPEDGSTINVWVDGVNKGHPHYNNYRKDIAEFFPDLENKDGAAGFFYFDTTGYADGVYTIQWTATDNEGSTDGIGSRYFSILNTDDGDSIKANAASQNQKYSPPIRVQQLMNLPIDHRTPVKMRKGFGKDIQPREIYTGDDGLIQIEIKELERIELNLSASFTDTSKISGYLVVGDRIQSLPIGSTLKDGVFYWMPGMAFFGEYRLVFIEQGPDGNMNRKDIIVNIGPKFE